MLSLHVSHGSIYFSCAVTDYCDQKSTASWRFKQATVVCNSGIWHRHWCQQSNAEQNESCTWLISNETSYSLSLVASVAETCEQWSMFHSHRKFSTSNCWLILHFTVVSKSQRVLLSLWELLYNIFWGSLKFEKINFDHFFRVISVWAGGLWILRGCNERCHWVVIL